MPKFNMKIRREYDERPNENPPDPQKKSDDGMLIVIVVLAAILTAFIAAMVMH